MTHVLSTTFNWNTNLKCLLNMPNLIIVVILLGFVGVCIAPATLALTMMLLTIQGLHRLLHMAVSRIGADLPTLKTRLTLGFGRE